MCAVCLRFATTLLTSQDPGNNLVWDLALVLVVVLAVLIGAPRFVAKGTVDEQDGQEHVVKVWHKVVETGRDAPKNGPEDFRQVMEMAARAPVALDEKQGGALGPVPRVVFGHDLLCRRPKHRALSPVRPEHGTLVVRIVVHKDG